MNIMVFSSDAIDCREEKSTKATSLTRYASQLPLSSYKADDDIVNKLVAFVSAFDGSPDAWARAKPIMDEIFDPNLILQTEHEGNADFQWFVWFSKVFAEEGNITWVEHLERTDVGVRVFIRNFVRGKNIGTSEHRGIIKNGRIVYWTAMPAAMVDKVLHYIKEQRGWEDGLARKYARFIDAFDGSPDSWATAKPLYEKMHDTNLSVVTGKKKDNYESSKIVFERFAKTGQASKVLAMKRTKKGLHATIWYVSACGEDLGVSEQRGYVKNGKVVRWEAVPGKNSVGVRPFGLAVERSAKELGALLLPNVERGDDPGDNIHFATAA